MVVLALGLPVLCEAQAVRSVNGERLTLSVGESAGVRVGMTGRACRTETVGEKTVEVCPAKFEVVEVLAESATARVTKGDGAAVQPGFRVVFDEVLLPKGESRAGSGSANKAGAKAKRTAAQLKADADRLYDAKQWALAGAAYAELAERFPNHPDAEYARGLASACEERAKQAKVGVENEKREAEARRNAARLVAEARRLLDAGQAGEALKKAEAAVGLDSGNADALATLSLAREKLRSCPEGMVLVPGGSYRLGNAGRDATVERYCLDVTEVTVGAFTGCAKAGRCSAASSTVWTDFPGVTEEQKRVWSGYCNRDRADRWNHPVNCVDWEQADAYCRWAGRRLPTEEEWEWAARGGERGTTYPWGNAEPGSQLCWNGHGSDLGKGNRQSTCAVGSYPMGDSPQGVKDLAGNVWEWTSTPERLTYPGEQTVRDVRVDRGGGWSSDDPSFVSAAYRFWKSRGGRFSNLGFRCARTAQ
jgi:formylglycine-generating enzyme required for sulfatase activity